MRNIRKILLPVLLAAILCGCAAGQGETVAQVESAPAEETTIAAETTAPAETAGQTAAAAAAPETAAATAPTSAYTEEEVLAAYRSVLAGASFQDVDSGLPLTLNTGARTMKDYVTDTTYTLSKFLLLDLDADGTQELMLWLSTDSEECAGYRILHYVGGEVLCYSLPYRSLDKLKEDGTYLYRDSDYASGIGRIEFEEDGCGFRYSAFYKAGTDSAGNVIAYHAEVDGREVTQEEYEAAYAQHLEKPNAVWLDYDSANLRQAGLAE